VIGLTDLDEFRTGLLEALRRAAPSDYASLNDLGFEPDDATVIGIPDPPSRPSRSRRPSATGTRTRSPDTTPVPATGAPTASQI
jgi:hypothetical protein